MMFHAAQRAAARTLCGAIVLGSAFAYAQVPGRPNEQESTPAAGAPVNASAASVPNSTHPAQTATATASSKPLPKGQFPSEPITRTLLQRVDATGMPGYETRIYLIEYGPNVKAPLHHHPVPGVGYVLSGGILSGFSGRYPNRYEAGQSFIDVAGEPHTLVQNVSATDPVRFVIAYTVKRDDPVTITP